MIKIFPYKTKRRQMTLVFHVKTKRKSKINIIVEDYKKPNTKYSDRSRTIYKNGIFIIRLPQSPYIAKITITDNTSSNDSFSFKIEERKLKQKLSSFDFNNPKIRSFINFSNAIFLFHSDNDYSVSAKPWSYE